MQLPSPIAIGELLRSCPSLSKAQGSVPSGLLNLKIHSLDSPRFSTENSLSFLKNASALPKKGFAARLVISEEPIPTEKKCNLLVADIYPVIHELLEMYFTSKPNTHSINPNFPHAKVFGRLGDNVKIGAGCFVSDKCEVKDNVILEPNVTLLDNVVIGNGSYIQSGVVVGSSGFGFYAQKKKQITMPHLAGVVVEDNCWLGANTVIASGVLNPTFIGAYSRLDSHIQIAHNVYLGHHATIASQSGIAGSTYIGPYFTMGGASSVTGHIEIGENVTVAARSGVTKSLPSKAVVAGFPAQAIKNWKKQLALLRKLEAELKGKKTP